MSYEQKVFKIEIDLGNEEMQSGEDIAAALEKVASQVRAHKRPEPFHSLRIHDRNGNTVGGWNIEYQLREE